MNLGCDQKWDLGLGEVGTRGSGNVGKWDLETWGGGNVGMLELVETILYSQ